MALGQRRAERQQELWVATAKLPASIGHVFYDALNRVLRDGKFDNFAESLCKPFYKDGGRPGIPPGIYFRMVFVGYFEGIDSQRGVVGTVCRCGSFSVTNCMRTRRSIRA